LDPFLVTIIANTNIIATEEKANAAGNPPQLNRGLAAAQGKLRGREGA
jgi:hypothetical protein